MKKILYILVALPLLFAACNKNNEPEKLPIKEAAMTLISNDVETFNAKGGDGVIEFKHTQRFDPNLDEIPAVDVNPFIVSCTAEWIDIEKETYDTTIPFTVAANTTTEERSTKITISASPELYIEVTVTQDGGSSYAVDVNMAAAARIPSAELGFMDYVFALVFTDDAESMELGIVLVGDKDDAILQAGEYSAQKKNIELEECVALFYETNEEYLFTDGSIIVTNDEDFYTFDITLTDEDGALHHYTYEGVVMDMEPEEPEVAVAFTPVKVVAQLWEPANFLLKLYIDDVYYHELDMYDFVGSNSDYLAAGTYTTEDMTQNISSWSTFSLGNDRTSPIIDAEITLSHNGNKTTIVGYIISEDGDHITIDWTGVVEGFNL